MTIKIIKCNNAKNYPTRVENYIKAADHIYVDRQHSVEEIISRYIHVKNKVPIPIVCKIPLSEAVHELIDGNIIRNVEVMIHRIVDTSYKNYKIEVNVYNTKYTVIGDNSGILGSMNYYNIIIFLLNNRFEFKIKLGNMFRAIKFMIANGKLNIEQLNKISNAFGNKFTSNFIKLLNDKSKSKRFKLEILPRHTNVNYKGRKGFAVSNYTENGLFINIYDKIKETTFLVNSGANNRNDIQKED